MKKSIKFKNINCIDYLPAVRILIKHYDLDNKESCIDWYEKNYNFYNKSDAPFTLYININDDFSRLCDFWFKGSGCELY